MLNSFVSGSVYEEGTFRITFPTPTTSDKGFLDYTRGGNPRNNILKIYVKNSQHSYRTAFVQIRAIRDPKLATKSTQATCYLKLATCN